MEFYKTYFLYRHIRLDKNEPFYIGIGKRSTSDMRSGHCSRAYNKSKRSVFWKNVVLKTEYDVEILFETNNETLIIDKEKEFIKLYGRRNLGLGPLVNLTDGGDFFEGYKQTPEVKERQLKGLREQKRTPEQYKKMVATRNSTGSYKRSQETNKKQSLSRLGMKLSSESIIKRTITLKENKRLKYESKNII